MRPSYFCLTHRPFPANPSTQFYYPAGTHENAVELLRQSFIDGEGFAILTGGVGSGKTLVAHLLLERMGQDMNRVLLTHCRLSAPADLFRALLFDLGQDFHGLGEQELRLAFNQYLLDEFGAGKSSLLVLDEAQGLTLDLLEELRLLSNLESSRGKAVQILLVGQDSLLETVASPPMAALQQRIAARAALEPLDLLESCDYLAHQLRLAGGRPEKIITDEALRLIAATARGIPRLLNRYAYQSLVFAEQASADRVDAEVVIEAMARLGIEPSLSDDDATETQPVPTAALAQSETLSARVKREPSGQVSGTNLGLPHLGGRTSTVSLEAPWIAGNAEAYLGNSAEWGR